MSSSGYLEIMSNTPSDWLNSPYNPNYYYLKFISTELAQ